MGGMATGTSEVLPFSEVRQSAVLGHTILDPHFFKRCVDLIQPTWWSNVFDGRVWTARRDFYKRFGMISTDAELLDSDGFRLENQGVRNRMIVAVEQAKLNAQHYRLETLIPELTDWLHARFFHEGMDGGEQLFNQQRFREAYALMREKLRLIDTTSFEQDNAFDFSDPVSFVQSRMEEAKAAISFGLAEVDKLLLPSGEGRASLLPGDTTTILAPTNIGKTTALITVIAHNLWEQKAVLWLSHEGKKEDLADKVWCAMLGVNRDQFYRMVLKPENDAERQAVRSTVATYERFFKYVPMNRPGLTVEEVAAEVDRRQHEYASQYGQGYDMLVDDYPAKLTSRDVGEGIFREGRSLRLHVYNYFVQMALEYNFHALLAAQTNRTGYKINKQAKGHEQRLLGVEDSDEAFGPMQVSTNVLTLNRNSWCQQNNWVIWYISKSRSNQTGWAIAARSKFANCVTHSNTLGALYYYGDTPLDQQLTVLAQRGFVGKEVTSEMISAVMQGHAVADGGPQM